MFISLVILSTISGQIRTHTNNPWLWIPIIVVALYTFWYFNKLVLKIQAEKYGSWEHFQEIRYAYLLDVLKSNDIYNENDLLKTRDRINVLIGILNNKLNNEKLVHASIALWEL